MPKIANTGKKPVATMPKPPAPKPQPTVPPPAPTPAPQPKPVPIPSAALIKSNVPIPGFLQSVNMPETSNRQQTGYVGFASTQSNKWMLQQQAGLIEGQPFLYHNNAYIPLDTLEFFLCVGTSFQTMMAGKKGEFIFVTRDMNIRMEDTVYNGNVCKLDPHYVTLLLVNMNGTLLPIKGDFRGTKSGGIENAIRAIEAAANPDWLKLSDLHKATAAFPQPFGRVYNVITTKRGISKRNGNPYFTADCTCTPASVSQMQVLVSALKEADFVNTLTEAHNNYLSRVKFLDDMIGKDLTNPANNTPT